FDADRRGKGGIRGSSHGFSRSVFIRVDPRPETLPQDRQVSRLAIAAPSRAISRAWASAHNGQKFFLTRIDAEKAGSGAAATGSPDPFSSASIRVQGRFRKTVRHAGYAVAAPICT